jgi:hypothetical protein
MLKSELVEGNLVIDGETMDGDVTSLAVKLPGRKVQLSVEAWTAGATNTHTGPFYIQVSNTGDRWNTKMTLVTLVNTGLLDHFSDNIETTANYIRLFWDRTAGAIGEALSAVIAVKEQARS